MSLDFFTIVMLSGVLSMILIQEANHICILLCRLIQSVSISNAENRGSIDNV